MNKKIFVVSLTLICGAMFLLQSCATTKRNLVYFSNLPDSVVYNELITNNVEPKIQPGDALAIKVTTLNPDANILFNSGSLPMDNQSTGVSSSVSATASLPDGYIVDDDGFIDFPQLGKIKLEGLTKEQAQQKIAVEVAKTAKEPIINIRILNFKISVLGEVQRSGSFTIPNNKINVLEALSLAGDMTPYAIRDDVLVIREHNGHRIVKHINFNDKALLNSPFYNLQQNDIVYVRPENKLKAAQAANPALNRSLPIISASVSVIAILLSRLW
ncbi:polysaccharide export outer membrane protein [Arachidicoccus rhizosphaerae]|uniref:Polysaccharide export outer membrane protein n=1 Tax=Arachidicoccus rhizosphaerae TaxID=551991 RepID=A0A1H4CPP9_9BACT|nr:polysaccharide biosynthesis/export family protein [Arachidicoccus rhizosphaerae]SEA62300.1 polysaccharide export outer membrane protein [Arachidicoccus rhizosphaerae]